MALPAAQVDGIVPNGMSSSSRRDSAQSVNTLTPHDDVHFDAKLKPKSYQIKGTKSDSKVLFVDVNILDSTGKDPYHGDVYIEGEALPCRRLEHMSD